MAGAHADRAAPGLQGTPVGQQDNINVVRQQCTRPCFTACSTRILQSLVESGPGVSIRGSSGAFT